ncbi:MAG: amidohydrolase [Planctomycetes bacterium]|nr:amidohydrolase [Planctomycetota bacterium]
MPRPAVFASMVVLSSLAAGCASQDRGPREPADRIIVGAVVTLDERMPRAEAVAMRGGRVQAVGSADEVLALRGPRTIVTHLSRAVVLPGFVDAHGHLAQVALRTRGVSLDPPPLGAADSIAAIQDRLRAELPAERDDWLVGWGYDDALLAERRHPTRQDLDAVSTTRPILLVHRSGRIVTLNSVGLERAGVTAATRDPPGGRIRREPLGAPTGVLEERAALRALEPLRALRADPERLGDAVRDALARYAARGVTTCRESLASAELVDALRGVAARGPLPLDVAVSVSWRGTTPERLLGDKDPGAGGYLGGLRLCGVELVLDGSLHGHTAWLSAPYHAPPAGALSRAACEDPLTSDGALPPTATGERYAGYPSFLAREVEALVRRCLDGGWAITARCHGDAAVDQLLDALERAAAERPDAPRRVTLVAQLLRDDQLERMARLGVPASFLAADLFFWGDHLRDALLGPERAARLAPGAAALARGVPFSLHDDAPSAPPDPLRAVAVAASRRTAGGAVLGPEQRVRIEDALRAVTLEAARQLGEEDDKGSITPDKLADLVILSADPTACAPEAITTIEVLQTIKAGAVVYDRGQRAADE